MPVPVRTESETLSTVRRTLLWILLFGLAGTGTELLLLGHIEGATQWLPVVLIALSTLVGAWHGVVASRASLRSLQALMLVCGVAGAAGVVLHYQGNLEFELEMYPTLSGRELIQKVATGATPVLAPGTLSLLGMVGLLHTYRHPAGRDGATSPEE